jgi:5-formyltetrahydrofolate cyclo-ligase
LDVRRAKEAARRAARATRSGLALAGADWAAGALPYLEQALAGRLPPFALAGYHPVHGEADVLPLLAALGSRGVVTALPSIVAPDRPLRFQRWQGGDPAQAGLHGIPIPAPDRPVLRPDVILVPLLAFDRFGRRLGYGAGYYDRTLAALRSESSAICAIGVGYAGQELAEVPADALDQRLDWLVTEREAIRVV